MTFADKIRKRLEELKLSQADLAEAIGTSQPQVSGWLNQGVIPSTAYVLKSAKFLGLSTDYLLDDSIDLPPHPLSESESLLLVVARDLGVTSLLRELASGRLKLSDAVRADTREAVAKEVELERGRVRLQAEYDAVANEFLHISAKLTSIRDVLGKLEAEQNRLDLQRRELLDESKILYNKMGKLIEKLTELGSRGGQYVWSRAPLTPAVLQRIAKDLDLGSPVEQPTKPYKAPRRMIDKQKFE